MLAKEGGIPTVLLGPGSIFQAHTADEYVEVDELRRATAVYIDLMRSWWGLD
jgi:acetylornithine deacetylase